MFSTQIEIHRLQYLTIKINCVLIIYYCNILLSQMYQQSDPKSHIQRAFITKKTQTYPSCIDMIVLFVIFHDRRKPQTLNKNTAAKWFYLMNVSYKHDSNV